MRIFILCGVLLFALTGCTMPTTTVKTVDSRPSISIAGAPDDAVLLVDGIQIGAAASYNGEPTVLIIEPGTHRITVQQGGVVIYDQQVFVESEHKRITVR
jgi:hypothetical protein